MSTGNWDTVEFGDSLLNPDPYKPVHQITYRSPPVIDLTRPAPPTYIDLTQSPKRKSKRRKSTHKSQGKGRRVRSRSRKHGSRKSRKH